LLRIIDGAYFISYGTPYFHPVLNFIDVSAFKIRHLEPIFKSTFKPVLSSK